MVAAVYLRPAVPADAAALRRWDAELSQTVDWQDYRIAMLGERSIGVVLIIDAAREESHYWGDCPTDMWTIDIWIGETDCLSKGFRRQMMDQALALCFAKPGVAAVWVDPLSNTIRSSILHGDGIHIHGSARIRTGLLPHLRDHARRLARKKRKCLKFSSLTK